MFVGSLAITPRSSALNRDIARGTRTASVSHVPVPTQERSTPSDVEEASEYVEDPIFVSHRPSSGNVAVASRLVIGTAVLATVAVVAWHAPMASSSTSEAASDQQLWFNPNPGHYDAQGNFVADTWDHFVMPNCDSGFIPAKYVSRTVTDDETGETTEKKTYVPRHQSPAQKACAWQKQVAYEFHEQQIRDHWSFVKNREEVTDVHRWQTNHSCSAQLVNTDFKADGHIEWNVEVGKPSGAHCQKACTESERGCDGFSWIAPWGCYLKQLNGTTDFKTIRKAGVYSGYPCQKDDWEYPWIEQESEKFTLPDPNPPRAAKNTSMLCLELVVPFSAEMDLVVMQYSQNISIFQCEKYAVYSSQLLQIADGLVTRRIDSSQMAEAAGQWGTALNTEIFMAFWRSVINDGEYLGANWIVKVDPDTVWFPDRLRPILRNQEQDEEALHGKGIYLNNCHAGLHGPIEIFSQNSIHTLASSSSQCYESMKDWGDAQWGEDMWVDQCFLQVGHAKRVYVDVLLAEDHCNKWPGWTSCTANKIAFHPFKDVQAYRNCAAHGEPTPEVMVKK
eukprot:gb/GFBE01017331.1/.p1 GENE.gb/GFBE01017331.1/~~gb/GFBE01017331.1/.p1  ORF type:complete len:562 (+),score=97.24 gb/GFBE01017331.1/:1-1686(+)